MLAIADQATPVRVAVRRAPASSFTDSHGKSRRRTGGFRITCNSNSKRYYFLSPVLVFCVGRSSGFFCSCPAPARPRRQHFRQRQQRRRQQSWSPAAGSGVSRGGGSVSSGSSSVGSGLGSVGGSGVAGGGGGVGSLLGFASSVGGFGGGVSSLLLVRASGQGQAQSQREQRLVDGHVDLPRRLSLATRNCAPIT